ncbi:MAG: carboxypeptidase regulatory-like domain-containing protein [Candidatus Acidiferrales bacterium]
MKSIRLLLALFLAAGLFAIGAPQLLAQSSSTGAITGTVTDQTGAVIAGATVTITSLATGQTRTATTDANGSYKFGLLPPGDFSATFSATGFKTSTVSSVTVNVAETPVLNRKLEVGEQTQKVTVEATTQALQTQTVANGGVVTGQEITKLPLVSRNYTQVISLSPGVVANAATASAIGNGTQDVSANGSTANENNYSMDGSSVVNYVSGMAAQEGSFPGIAIPNPDAIQEFKVQTSQYDASSGRNPGANVDVVTKTGTNQFHGDAWEFNRNNFFNGNDFFYKHSELDTAAGGSGVNTPQTLKQNTFGFTFGGPIKKDKLFFFGSYQGIRQVNGIGTSGFASGYESAVQLVPWDDYADFQSGACSDLRCTNNVAAYRAYLGTAFGGQAAFPGFLGGTGQTVAADGSNISNTAISMLQAKGVTKGGYNNGFYFASAPQSCGLAGCTLAISDPTRVSENQYIANSEYVINSKHSLYVRYMYQRDPEDETFNCFILVNNCNPGAPINAYYGNHVASLELQSVLTPNFVNQARFSFHRDVENNTDPNASINTCSLPNGGAIVPLVNNGAPCGTISTPALAKRFSEMEEPPMLDILGIGGAAWSQGGNFSMISSNFIDTFQFGDQVSWNHGRHSIRAAFEGQRVDYNNTIPASGRGELLMYSTADFLTSSSGVNAQDPTYSDGTPQTPTGGIALGFGLKGPLTHYNRINEFDAYVQDDFKVSSRLTLNLGVRWEYSGFPDDVSGEFSNVWNNQLAKVNTGSAFSALNSTGTLAGFIVPSNFAVSTFGLTAPGGASGVLVNSNKTLLPGTPLHNFAPRLGLAWQPFGDKFVVRAGYGWFWDTIYGNLLIDNQLNLPPYSGAASGSSPQSEANTLHDPWYAGAGPLVWTPRYMFEGASFNGAPCPTSPTLNHPTGVGICSSGFGYTSDAAQMGSRLPLVQEYSLDLQYQLPRNWILDVGYVGSHGTHLYDWSQTINVAHLVAGAPNEPTVNSGLQNEQMVLSSLPYNDSANPDPITANTIGAGTTNINERVSYLGFAPGGDASTNTYGDSLYNSLQAQLRHQFAAGLLVQFAYTWSKEFTNINTSAAGSGIQPPGEVIFGAATSNNPLNMAQQYGLASYNRPQRAVISYVYDLPYKNTHGFTGKAFGGWSVSGVTTIQDGLPFWIQDGGGATIYGAGTSRAALVDPINCSASTGNCQSGIAIATSGSSAKRATPGNYWVNPSAFISLSATGSGPYAPLPASSPYCIGGVFNPAGSSSAPCGSAGATYVNAGTGYGNSGIGTILGPGQFNFDMSLIKNTKITEGTSLEFHLDAFNVFNHAQFNPPGNDINTPSTFAIIQSTSVTPRVFQFGLKFLF